MLIPECAIPEPSGELPHLERNPGTQRTGTHSEGEAVRQELGNGKILSCLGQGARYLPTDSAFSACFLLVGETVGGGLNEQCLHGLTHLNNGSPDGGTVWKVIGTLRGGVSLSPLSVHSLWVLPGTAIIANTSFAVMDSPSRTVSQDKLIPEEAFSVGVGVSSYSNYWEPYVSRKPSSMESSSKAIPFLSPTG